MGPICLIAPDGAMLDDNFTGDPAAIEQGQSIVYAPMDAAGYTWDAEKRGFRLIAAPAPISAQAFKLLFTQAEHVAVLDAAPTDPAIRYYLDLINTPSSGIDLAHPLVIGGVQHLVDAGLITTGRAAAVLAGYPPA